MENERCLDLKYAKLSKAGEIIEMLCSIFNTIIFTKVINNCIWKNKCNSI